MNSLVKEIEQSKFDIEKLKLLEFPIQGLKPGSPTRILYAQVRRMANLLKANPSFLDEKMPHFPKRQDAEIEMERYSKLLIDAYATDS